MATINLGQIKFNWRGAYSGATAYVVDDVVESSGSSYICIAATTGNAPPNASYWEQMSSAGTNGTDGTDLTSTLTTQGDIVYRDASGLARLGAGTAGQVLQSGGTGANVSWTNVSSDYVLLGTSTVTSNTGTIKFDGLFSSTYDNYYFMFYDLDCTTNGTNIIVRFIQGNNGTPVTTSSYKVGRVNDPYYDSSISGNSADRDWGSSGMRIDRDNLGTATGGAISQGILMLTKPLDTSNQKMMMGSINYKRTDGATYQKVDFSGVLEDTTAVTGIAIQLSAGDFNRGTAKLYGIK